MRWGRARDSLQRVITDGQVVDLTLPPGDVAWLVCEGKVLASLEVMRTRSHRARGLLGRSGCDGGVLLWRVRSVHSFGMSFELDVAFLDRTGTVVRTARLPRNRLSPPVWRSWCVIEAEAGAFGQWGLKIGDRVEFRC